MATIPTTTEVRAQLEGYNITPAILSDTWITAYIAGVIVPFVNRCLQTDIQSEQTITEYYSGTGNSLLFLNRKNITEVTNIVLVRGEQFLTSISLSSIDLISNEGMLKAKQNLNEGMYFTVFPKGDKNLKVTYKIGGSINDEQKYAMTLLTACGCLTHIEGRTGGGELSVQAFSRNYGNMGKYSNVRTQWNNQAMMILKRYMTPVTGA